MAREAGNRGIALIGVILVLAMLMGLAAALAVAVTSDTQLRGAFGRGITGLYAAESGLNTGMAEFKNKFLNFGVPYGSDFDARSFTLGDRSVTYQLTERAGNPQSITIPPGELFGGLNSLQYTYTVNSKAGISEDVEAEVGAEFNVGYIPLFQFVAFYIPDLEILPGPPMRLHGRIHANEDLYLNAEASGGLFIEDNPAGGITTVQVSTAGNVYRGRKNNGNCNGTVKIDKLEDVESPFGDLDPKELPCIGGTRLVSQSELAEWKGSIISGIESISVPEPDIISRGGGEFWQKADLRIVLNLEPSVTGGLAGGQPLPYRIEVQDAAGNADEARTATLYQFMIDNAFNTASSSMRGTMPVFYTDVPIAGGSCTCTDANAVGCTNNVGSCYNPPFRTPPGSPAEGISDSRVYRSSGLAADRDHRRGGFYNWRERKWMLLLNVNIGDLLRWNSLNGQPFFQNGDTTDGGLVVFLSVQGPNSNGINNYGVRVFGGANLTIPGGIGVSPDPTGITVVSDQAMYVIGDYNRGPVLAGDLPKQPAALIGDSVNVLSNNYWDFANNCNDGCSCGGTRRNDCQSNQELSHSSRVAASTRINSAFLSGVDETIGTAYNGGLENYPRFHESWSASGNRTLTYNGSFVSLGNPQHVNGPWCGTGGSSAPGCTNCCNIYNPPVRSWDYEPAFNDAANLPPLTPRFVYVQQVLFTESFK
jgi:hypothetical protein